MAEESSGAEYGLLHLIGSDRIGILQDASAFVVERGGTVEQGISHALGTEAVVLLYVSGQPLQIERIQRDTARFGETLNLFPLFTRIEDPEAVGKRITLKDGEGEVLVPGAGPVAPWGPAGPCSGPPSGARGPPGPSPRAS